MEDSVRPAAWNDVLELSRKLNQAGVEYVLVGGYALAAHGADRQTRDIDIVVNPTLENQRKWTVVLAELPGNAAKELVDEKDNLFSPDFLYAIRVCDDIVVDIMPQAGGQSWQTLKGEIETLHYGNTSIPVVSLRGLLLTKFGDRPQDIADRHMIEAALAEMEKDNLSARKEQHGNAKGQENGRER